MTASSPTTTQPVSNNQPLRLPNRITALLRGLSWRIRAYSFFEGLALAVIWLGVTFWVGLAIDYLPVMMGADEMPRAARAILLILIASVLAWILFRWIVHRVFATLRQRNMAMLLERRFPDLGDSLITAVELEAKPDRINDINRHMIASVADRANAHVDRINLRGVFNFYPLVRNIVGATIATTSIVLFGLFATDAFATWTSRLYGLSNAPWPRRTAIELLDFRNGVLKAAKGSDVTIRVRADAKRDTPPPEVCTLFYTTVAGDYGRLNMSKEGEPAAGYQEYAFRGKPFQGILDSVVFDVVGNDHRLRDNQVIVVDSPSVVGVQLHSQPPAYTGLLPRDESWSPGIRLPRGSSVLLRFSTNKPLRRVEITDSDTKDGHQIDFDADDLKQFQYRREVLTGRMSLEIVLHDTDGVRNQQPFRIDIGAVEDQPPSVTQLLQGIGKAITPDAKIPSTGDIIDDYGVDRAWFELEVSGGARNELPFEFENNSQYHHTLDLRDQRSLTGNDRLELAAGQHVSLTLKAVDRFDLDGQPHTGQADRYDLDVLEPDELLALLEARELYLRRLFEQTLAETRGMRDQLMRVRAVESQKAASEPDDKPSEGASVADAEKRAAQERSLKLLRTQRAIRQNDKSVQEIAGVANGFSDIRDELINNRIDTQQRKDRLQQQIAVPLRVIVNDLFPELQQTLEKLETQLTAESRHEEQAKIAVAQADAIVAAMESILEKMLELETYNELVDIVRSIIKEQDTIRDKTQAEQKRQALELLDLE